MSNENFQYGQTGFTSAGAEFAEERTSSDKYLNLDKPQTFTMIAKGNSRFLSIKDGDRFIVSRGHEIWHGCKVVAYIQNQFVIGQLVFFNQKVFLQPFNVEIGTEENPDDHIWGVITHRISNELPRKK